MNCAIVLAAGESRRMGAAKPLLPSGRTTIIGHVADQLLASKLDEVYAVVGHEGDRIAAALSGRPVRIVTNPNYQAGMLSSIRAGLEALPPSCESVLIALGDQPAVTGELVDRLLDAYAKSGKRIVVPVFRGQRGHPLLFSARFREEVLTRYDEVGLRGLLLAHPAEVCEVDGCDESVLSDIDLPEDYQRETARFDEGR
jgi:molybdenum cofactor cytidylyltransferase